MVSADAAVATDGSAGASDTPRMYLTSLAVEDLREYDALLLATLLLLIGLFLSARCSRVLTSLREARHNGAASKLSAVLVGGEDVSARRRSKARQKRRGKKPAAATAAAGQSSSSEEVELDDLAAEEQAFLDAV